MTTDIYMTVTNADGEVMTEGACTQESVGSFEKTDHPDSCYILAFEQRMTLPTDSRTGQVTGNPNHVYLKVKKFIDRSSPLLAGNLVNPSELTVEFEFYRQGSQGQEGYYTITLEGAQIVDILSHSPDILNPQNDTQVACEWVTFSYNKVSWDHEICSTSAADDATGR